MSKKFSSLPATGALVIILMMVSPFAQGSPRPDELRMSLKHDLLVRINRDRAKFGLSPVSLDPQASVIADGYCERQIIDKTTGHFTVDGQPPYMRYSLAGGNDGISENAAAWSANYSFTHSMIPELIRLSQDAMLSEEPPDDGHRRTILDPFATHVGIGIAWKGGEFRLAQEFVRRYVRWNQTLPRAAFTTERLTASATPLAGYRIEAITVHHESHPRYMPPVVANAIHNYSLPAGRRDYLPRLDDIIARTRSGLVETRRARYLDGRRGDFDLARDGSFTFGVPFPDGPGVYTVVVWVSGKKSEALIPASNVSIRVERPGAESGSLSSR